MSEKPRTEPADDVDIILSAWKRELPHVNTDPMQIISRITRLTRRFDLTRRKAFGTQALEPWEFDVLAALRRAGEPYSLTPGALMADTLVSSGTMTNRLDRLEEAKLVTRTPSPEDRRAVLVTLTDLGRERVDEALRTLIDFEDSLLSPLSHGERATLSALLRRLMLAIETD